MADPTPAPAAVPAPVPAPPSGFAGPVASGSARTGLAEIPTAEPAARLVPAAPAPPVEPAPESWQIDMLFQPPRRSESIASLAKALAAAQREISGAVKDSKNPHYKNLYSSLGAIWNACREPLGKNGLAVLQPVTASGKAMVITTILTHESGEWIEQPLMMTAQQNTPQAVGSTITYARRYALAAMVGVAPEDDDGEAATRTLPGAVVQDSRSTPLQNSAAKQLVVEPVAPLVNAAPPQPAAEGFIAVGAASTVPPPPGRPPMKAPGSK